MNDLVKSVKYFIVFDFTLKISIISSQFATTHDSYQKQFVYWSFSAARRKLISNFWLRLVLYHYFIILGLAAIVTLPLTPNWNGLLLSIFLGGFVSLFTM